MVHHHILRLPLSTQVLPLRTLSVLGRLRAPVLDMAKKSGRVLLRYSIVLVSVQHLLCGALHINIHCVRGPVPLLPIPRQEFQIRDIRCAVGTANPDDYLHT